MGKPLKVQPIAEPAEPVGEQPAAAPFTVLELLHRAGLAAQREGRYADEAALHSASVKAGALKVALAAAASHVSADVADVLKKFHDAI